MNNDQCIGREWGEVRSFDNVKLIVIERGRRQLEAISPATQFRLLHFSHLVSPSHACPTAR